VVSVVRSGMIIISIQLYRSYPIEPPLHESWVSSPTSHFDEVPVGCSAFVPPARGRPLALQIGQPAGPIRVRATLLDVPLILASRVASEKARLHQ
jgi:hypothetical protein